MRWMISGWISGPGAVVVAACCLIKVIPSVSAQDPFVASEIAQSFRADFEWRIALDRLYVSTRGEGLATQGRRARQVALGNDLGWREFDIRGLKLTSCRPWRDGLGDILIMGRDKDRRPVALEASGGDGGIGITSSQLRCIYQGDPDGPLPTMAMIHRGALVLGFPDGRCERWTDSDFDGEYERLDRVFEERFREFHHHRAFDGARVVDLISVPGTELAFLRRPVKSSGGNGTRPSRREAVVVTNADGSWDARLVDRSESKARRLGKAEPRSAQYGLRGIQTLHDESRPPLDRRQSYEIESDRRSPSRGKAAADFSAGQGSSSSDQDLRRELKHLKAELAAVLVFGQVRPAAALEFRCEKLNPARHRIRILGADSKLELRIREIGASEARGRRNYEAVIPSGSRLPERSWAGVIDENGMPFGPVRLVDRPRSRGLR